MGDLMPAMRSDWRLKSLLPAASFGLVSLLGFLAWNYLMLQTAPDFGAPAFADIAALRPSLGAIVAGKHAIVTVTLLLVISAGLLAAVAAWTAISITREVRSHALTAMSDSDAWLSIGVVVVVVSIPAVIGLWGETQCGAAYLHQCMGKGILPGLLENYLAHSPSPISPQP